MAEQIDTFHESSNGDRWALVRPEAGTAYVLHIANEPSGGARTALSIDSFLSRGSGPEHEALRHLIASGAFGAPEAEPPKSATDTAHAPGPSSLKREVPPMIHELRIYSCVSGRLPDLLNRFQTITLPLWEKHGIRQAGFWTTIVGPASNDLTYLIAWESLHERETKWTAFATDPDWLKAKAETERNGAIVANVASSFLQPTAFSAVQGRGRDQQQFG